MSILSSCLHGFLALRYPIEILTSQPVVTMVSADGVALIEGLALLVDKFQA
jgi:hypothetical protein